MTEKKEIFADGIGQIHFAGGMVRYDFVTLQPTEDGKAPALNESLRIVMPPQGFLAAISSMQELIGKLLEAGVLQAHPTAAAPAPEARAEAPAPAAVPAAPKAEPASRKSKNGKKGRK